MLLIFKIYSLAEVTYLSIWFSNTEPPLGNIKSTGRNGVNEPTHTQKDNIRKS